MDKSKKSFLNFIYLILFSVFSFFLLCPGNSCFDDIPGRYQVGVGVQGNGDCNTLTYPCGESFLLQIPTGYIYFDITKTKSGYQLDYVLQNGAIKNVGNMDKDGHLDKSDTDDKKGPNCESSCQYRIEFLAGGELLKALNF